jgi:pyruvate kinase
VRAISARLGCALAILQDLQGPKIRTGKLQDGKPVTLIDGSQVTITTRGVVGNTQIISTTYQPLPQDVKSGDRILLDDGLLELRALGTGETDVQCEVVHGGELGEHKGINLPGVAVSSPALTEKDRADLRFGIAQNVDFVALSFVCRPEDAREAKQLIRQYVTEIYASEDSRDIPLIVGQLSCRRSSNLQPSFACPGGQPCRPRAGGRYACAIHRRLHTLRKLGPPHLK